MTHLIDVILLLEILITRTIRALFLSIGCHIDISYCMGNGATKSDRDYPGGC